MEIAKRRTHEVVILVEKTLGQIDVWLVWAWKELLEFEKKV